jgi:hypothetical protein
MGVNSQPNDRRFEERRNVVSTCDAEDTHLLFHGAHETACVCFLKKDLARKRTSG